MGADDMGLPVLFGGGLAKDWSDEVVVRFEDDGRVEQGEGDGMSGDTPV